MRALAIGAVNLRRLGRDRIGLFFIFVFPVVLILLLGVSFGGDFTPRVGVVALSSGPFTDAVVESVGAQRGLETMSFTSPGELVDGVERGVVEAGIVVPESFDRNLAGSQGESAVQYLARPGDLSTALRATVEAAVADQAALVRAARFATAEDGGRFESTLETARSVEPTLQALEVDARAVGDRGPGEGLGRFDIGATTQLVLFTFVNSLGASVALVQSRRLGVSRRMLSAPVTPGTIVAGESLGRFLVAMVQGLFIIVAASLLFGVNWGDPLGAGALIVSFALVSTGAAMLFGALLSNEQQAGALTPLGLGMAALGGCMVPLEVFPPTMRTIAHVTPHAWAVEGFTELIREDAGLVDVLPQVAVLLAFALVLLLAASRLLRRAIVR